MPVTFSDVKSALGEKKGKSGHVQPAAPQISLDQPGRLRVKHLLFLLSIKSSTLYIRLKKGEIPAADGDDGRPYWNTVTVKSFLAAKAESPKPRRRPVARRIKTSPADLSTFLNIFPHYKVPSDSQD